MVNKPQYRDPAYQASRRRILADQPPCAICGKPGADTIDHIQPIELGGTNDEWNLRPAHRSCNSRLGANLVNSQTAHRMQQRRQAVFGTNRTLTTSEF